MAEEKSCPKCGYCDKCGRSNTVPVPPVSIPWAPIIPYPYNSGWRCFTCGKWVYPNEWHMCNGTNITTGTYTSTALYVKPDGTTPTNNV